MEPIDYLRLLRRRWRLLVFAILVAAVVSWVTTPTRPSDDQVTYEATHILLRDGESASPPAALAQVALFVESGEVPARVSERLDIEGSLGALVQRIVVKPDDASGSVEITASGPSRQDAADLANALGEETLATLGAEARDAQESEVEAASAEVDRLAAEIDDIDSEIAAARAAGTGTSALDAERDARVRQYASALDREGRLLDLPPPSAGYVSFASATPDLASPADGGFKTPGSRPVRMAIAVLLGLLAGLIVSLVAERLDPRIHTREAATAAFGLPVVAEVPAAARERGRGRRTISTFDNPLSATAEGYRTLRAAILLSPLTRLGDREGRSTVMSERRVVLVTSPTPGEGKTTTVANLAAAFAEIGRSVIVLSCDFRRPEIHRHFDADDRPGLRDVLVGKRDLQEVTHPTQVPRVDLAPDGGGLLQQGDLAAGGSRLIEQARQMADVVIIDTAPALATNDATELIPFVDAVVLACRAGRTTTDASRRSHALLERLGTPVVGVVLIGVAASETPYTGYYSSPQPPSSSGRAPRRRRRSIDIDGRTPPMQEGAASHLAPPEAQEGHSRG